MIDGDFIVCDDCHERYYRKDEHDCPGSPRDMAERIDGLERELHELERDHKALLRALLAFSEVNQLPVLRNMLETLLEGRE